MALRVQFRTLLEPAFGVRHRWGMARGCNLFEGAADRTPTLVPVVFVRHVAVIVRREAAFHQASHYLSPDFEAQ